MPYGTNRPARFGTSGSAIELTPAQNAQLNPVYAMIARSYRDDEVSKNVALAAAIRYLNTNEEFRDATIEDTAEFLREARDNLDLALAAARAVTILAIEDGRSEVAMSEAMGVDRMTIRKWRGKSR